MLLKKQTVWLLTMLSLVVVLSVYYITSPEQQQNELAAVDEQEQQEQVTEETDEITEETVDKGTEEATEEPKEEPSKESTKEPAEETTDKDAQIITNAAGDEAFETMRMQLMDERSHMKEDLEEKIGNTELSAEERSRAKEQMDEINEIAQKELLLETLIKAMNYEDVLVRADHEQVNITVKAEKQSKSEANKIIQTVRSELGPLHAVVTFQNAE